MENNNKNRDETIKNGTPDEKSIIDKKSLQNWDEREIVNKSTQQDRPEFERSNLNADREKRTGSNLNPDRNSGDR